MATTQFHHGARVNEVSNGTRNLQVISTAVIGLVATAPDADESVFPLNKAVKFTRISQALSAAGTEGTLRGALEAIASQVQPVIVIVRIPEGEGADPEAKAADQISKAVGTITAGKYSGVQALRTAQAQLGVTPRILGAPGLDAKPVADALASVAQALNAMSYVSAWECEDSSEAIAYRALFGQRETMVIWPHFTHWSTTENKSVPAPTVAYALGLRARIDREQGWHKTISNVALNGPDGLTHDVFWDLQNPDTDAGLLNADQVTTLINNQGFRFWGNRTCSSDANFSFESSTRTAQVVRETVAMGHFAYIDKPMTPGLVKDMIENINSMLRRLKADGYILDGKAWYEEELNTTETLKDGKLRIHYDYTPYPPLEDVQFTQVITDVYWAQFATRVAAGN